jgi:hypothetical protein
MHVASVTVEAEGMAATHVAVVVVMMVSKHVSYLSRYIELVETIDISNCAGVKSDISRMIRKLREAASVPVIRAAAEDRHRPVDLLGQHGAGQGVGPGLGAEGQHFVGAGANGGVVAVGGTDQEHQFALAAIAQLADMVGEGAAAPGLAALVAGDDAGVLKMGLELALGLVDLDDLDGSQAQGPPGGGGPGGVVEGKLSLGRA